MLAAVAALPITIVALAGYLAAWLRGWPPARLWHAACWSMPMTAVYAIGQGLRLRSWPAVALAPVNDWAGAWRLLVAHAVLRAGLLVAPVAVTAAWRTCWRRPAHPAPGSPPWLSRTLSAPPGTRSIH